MDARYCFAPAITSSGAVGLAGSVQKITICENIARLIRDFPFWCNPVIFNIALDNSLREPLGTGWLELEHWSFTFQKIKVTDNYGKTRFQDG